ncbi:hypothetical protein CEUSTIGMA_g9606.t1 [Chlamydomonas eustigma]|uniref:Uncharacterized protein n=1 Tax=Chlamydomonas eustigma TaxID=1157962 RepID=A0A250XGH5_9CHLO|nr:hypothetical protein CEUSTIGMA_g9606.t1 [Chlamydomonas eustigma]|eukprot:GAX82178.1 hypothetical protein CEUSTIGMA_g9606.t1 [Chlamydomonas eustigma]
MSQQTGLTTVMAEHVELKPKKKARPKSGQDLDLQVSTVAPQHRIAAHVQNQSNNINSPQSGNAYIDLHSANGSMKPHMPQILASDPTINVQQQGHTTAPLTLPSYSSKTLTPLAPVNPTQLQYQQNSQSFPMLSSGPNISSSSTTQMVGALGVHHNVLTGDSHLVIHPSVLVPTGVVPSPIQQQWQQQQHLIQSKQQQTIQGLNQGLPSQPQRQHQIPLSHAAQQSQQYNQASTSQDIGWSAMSVHPAGSYNPKQQLPLDPLQVGHVGQVPPHDQIPGHLLPGGHHPIHQGPHQLRPPQVASISPAPAGDTLQQQQYNYNNQHPVAGYSTAAAGSHGSLSAPHVYSSITTMSDPAAAAAGQRFKSLTSPLVSALDSGHVDSSQYPPQEAGAPLQSPPAWHLNLVAAPATVAAALSSPSSATVLNAASSLSVWGANFKELSGCPSVDHLPQLMEGEGRLFGGVYTLSPKLWKMYQDAHRDWEVCWGEGADIKPQEHAIQLVAKVEQPREAQAHWDRLNAFVEESKEDFLDQVKAALGLDPEFDDLSVPSSYSILSTDNSLHCEPRLHVTATDFTVGGHQQQQVTVSKQLADLMMGLRQDLVVLAPLGGYLLLDEADCAEWKNLSTTAGYSAAPDAARAMEGSDRNKQDSWRLNLNTYSQKLTLPLKKGERTTKAVVSGLGYGNEAQLVEKTVPSTSGSALTEKANCAVFLISIQGVPLPFLVLLEPPVAGLQLRRDPCTDGWKTYSTISRKLGLQQECPSRIRNMVLVNANHVSKTASGSSPCDSMTLKLVPQSTVASVAAMIPRSAKAEAPSCPPGTKNQRDKVREGGQNEEAADAGKVMKAEASSHIAGSNFQADLTTVTVLEGAGVSITPCSTDSATVLAPDRQGHPDHNLHASVQSHQGVATKIITYETKQDIRIKDKKEMLGSVDGTPISVKNSSTVSEKTGKEEKHPGGKSVDHNSSERVCNGTSLDEKGGVKPSGEPEVRLDREKRKESQAKPSSHWDREDKRSHTSTNHEEKRNVAAASNIVSRVGDKRSSRPQPDQPSKKRMHASSKAASPDKGAWSARDSEENRYDLNRRSHPEGTHLISKEELPGPPGVGRNGVYSSTAVEALSKQGIIPVEVCATAGTADIPCQVHLPGAFEPGTVDDWFKMMSHSTDQRRLELQPIMENASKLLSGLVFEQKPL